jgi:hypothetical protein
MLTILASAVCIHHRYRSSRSLCSLQPGLWGAFGCEQGIGSCQDGAISCENWSETMGDIGAQDY